MVKGKRKARITIQNGAKDAALNTRVDIRKKAALTLHCRSKYRTLSSLVQQWIDEYIEEQGLALPDLDAAITILDGVAKKGDD